MAMEDVGSLSTRGRLVIDLGSTLRMFSGHASAASRSRTRSEGVDIGLAMLLAYDRAPIELPAGFTMGATANVIGYSGNSGQESAPQKL